MRVVLANTELQSGLPVKSRSKDSKMQPLGTRLTYLRRRAVRLAISHSRAAIFRAFHSRLSPGFQLSFLYFEERRKETVSTEQVIEEEGSKATTTSRLRCRWVRGLSEISFRTCKVSYLWRFMCRLVVSRFSLSSSIRFVLSGCIVLHSFPLRFH